MCFAEPGTPGPFAVCLFVCQRVVRRGWRISQSNYSINPSISQSQSISARPHRRTSARPASPACWLQLDGACHPWPSTSQGPYTEHGGQTQDTQTTDTPCEAVGLLLAACTKAMDYMYSVRCSSRSTLTRQSQALLCMSVAGHILGSQARRGWWRRLRWQTGRSGWAPSG
jgi:hypothetical protein